jgi:hypothetical protein
MTEAARKVLPEEVRDTVQLYLQGKIDQWYVQKDQSGVVFMINTPARLRMLGASWIPCP